MSFIFTCSKCGWRGPNCPIYPQFDKNNVCHACQPPKKLSKKELLELESKERDYLKNNLTYE